MNLVAPRFFLHFRAPRERERRYSKLCLVGALVLAGGEDLLEVAVRSASRHVGVPARNVSSFGPVFSISRDWSRSGIKTCN